MSKTDRVQLVLKDKQKTKIPKKKMVVIPVDNFTNVTINGIIN